MHSPGSLLYMDLACAAFLLIEAAAICWLLRGRGDRWFFAVPFVLSLLAITLTWHHLALYRNELPAAPVPPPWPSGGGYLHDGPELVYTPALVLLTALVAFAGLVKALGKEPRWQF